MTEDLKEITGKLNLSQCGQSFTKLNDMFIKTYELIRTEMEKLEFEVKRSMVTKILDIVQQLVLNLQFHLRGHQSLEKPSPDSLSVS